MQNQQTRTPGSARAQFDSSANRVEHQFLTRMPDINSVENDLMKLLNDFSNSRLNKYSKPYFYSFLKTQIYSINYKR